MTDTLIEWGFLRAQARNELPKKSKKELIDIIGKLLDVIADEIVIKVKM